MAFTCMAVFAMTHIANINNIIGISLFMSFKADIRLQCESMFPNL